MSRWRTPSFLEMSMPSIEAIVRMPIPPTCTPAAMMTRPKFEKYSCRVTGVRPVTHTAEVATNRLLANEKSAGSRWAAGKHRSAVKNMMTTTNAPIASLAGDCSATLSTKSRAARAGSAAVASSSRLFLPFFLTVSQHTHPRARTRENSASSLGANIGVSLCE